VADPEFYAKIGQVSGGGALESSTGWLYISCWPLGLHIFLLILVHYYTTIDCYICADIFPIADIIIKLKRDDTENNRAIRTYSYNLKTYTSIGLKDLEQCLITATKWEICKVFS